jgi:hypothetical protein
MCFSATASFTSGALLGTVGYVALRQKVSLMTFIPVIFAVHQALEGLVWVTGGSGDFGRAAGYAYALVAFCLWPVYVPIAASAAEADESRKRLIRLMLWIGIPLTMFNAYTLYAGLDIRLDTGRCQYLPTIYYPIVLEYAYAATVVVPFLLCQNRILQAFGGTILLFFGVSMLYFNAARYSVWCFFAAASSIMLVSYAYSNAPRIDQRKLGNAT